LRTLLRETLLPGAVLLALLVPRPAASQSGAVRDVFEASGGAPFAALGHGLGAAGDLNGDGYPDLAVGSPGWGPSRSDSTGRVLIYLGGRRARWEPDLVIPGTNPGELFGFAVSGIGDVNGDGFDDLLIGAPGHAYPDPATQGSGRAYLYLGAVQLDDEPDLVFDAPRIQHIGSAAFFGGSIAAVGDASGDGYPDWSVGFDRAPTIGFGGALHYVGGARLSTTPTGFSGSIGSGRPVLSAAGDMNRDGLADLAFGAPALRNAFCYLQVVFGAMGTGISDQRWFSSSRTAGYGGALARAGDLNGDGYDDLLIGHPKGAEGGEVLVWYGGTTFPNVAPLGFTGSAPKNFGSALAVVRADGTGVRNLLVGASDSDAGGPGSGELRVYRLSQTAGLTPAHAVLGEPGAHLGGRVTGVGDADGNGPDDILVAGVGAGIADAGAVRMLTLSTYTLLAPEGPAEWTAGGLGEIRWLGADTARLSLSLDGGASWQVLRDFAGGADENLVTVPVPDTVTAGARVRISPAGSSGAAISSDVSKFSFSLRRSLDPPGVALRARLPVEGVPTSGRLGSALAGGADLDADGRPEAVLASPLADAPHANSGAVWVVSGPAAFDRKWEWSGLRGGERFGTAVAMGGDANGDGQPDLLVGSPGGIPEGIPSGQAELILGGDASDRRILVPGHQPGEDFGARVAWIGDFNRDGFDDFALAAPMHTPESITEGVGRVRVYFGSEHPDAIADLELLAPRGAGQFGLALAGIDFNADGAGDLAVSSLDERSRAGSVTLFFGGIAADATGDLHLGGRTTGDRFGAALANGGDLNGDGHADLLVGAPGGVGPAGITGRVDEFLSGPLPASTPIRSYAGLEPEEEFGASLGGGGDLNADGRDDLLVGAPGAAGGQGAVRLFLGGEDLAADGEWRGEQRGERFGAAVAGAGDTDGDGLREFVVGAPLRTYPGSSATGRVIWLDAPRYVIESPGERTRWFAGGRYAIRWRGAEPAEVALSVDAGRTWQALATTSGGAAENEIELLAPSSATDSAFVRLVPVRPGVAPVPVLRGPVAIGRAVMVKRFAHELTEAGIRLTWETEPGLGAQGLAAYRLYREAADGTRTRLGPEGIAAGEFTVAEFERGGSYVLAGVDGNGMEAELSRLTVAGPVSRLRAWPVPSAEFGEVQLSVFPPVDGAGRTARDFAVTVYDVNGRAVRRVAGGVVATRVGEVRASWDRRTADGAPARAGVYFVRAESPSRGFRMEQRIVVLR